MKAVRAYTCDDNTGSSFVVVTDNDRHIALSMRMSDVIKKGYNMSGTCELSSKWFESRTNIQPVELPDKEEV